MSKVQNRIILGMLTPSSNTVLEPTTTHMLESLDEVTAHFSRFKVTEISLSGHGYVHPRRKGLHILCF